MASLFDLQRGNLQRGIVVPETIEPLPPAELPEPNLTPNIDALRPPVRTLLNYSVAPALSILTLLLILLYQLILLKRLVIKSCLTKAVFLLRRWKQTPI